MCGGDGGQGASGRGEALESEKSSRRAGVCFRNYFVPHRMQLTLTGPQLAIHADIDGSV